MMAQEPFNATARTAELVPQTITVEDKTYRVKRSGKALKQIIEMTPDADAENADDPALNIDNLYKGLALMLLDQEGNHPDPEALSEELDFEVANELMEKFMPRRDEGNAVASVAADSTPT